jgi:arylsulfatase A-like enzyme
VVGRVLAALRRHGELEDTLVVVTGDHGEEFFEHGNLGHSHALWQELVHVPLLVWAPGLAPKRVTTQVRLMDVAPTILELVGLERGLPGAQGSSLMPVLAGLETTDRPAPLEVGGDQKPCWQWRGSSDGRMKLLRREKDLPTLHAIPSLGDEDEGPRPRWQLYDLATDPGERTNLFPERGDEARRLFAELEQRGWYVAPEALLGMQAMTSQHDPRQSDELNQLGYGGGEEGEPVQEP